MTGPPTVTLIRVQFDGTVRQQRLSAPDAVDELLRGRDNGRVYRSGRIEWGSVSAAQWPAGGKWAPLPDS